MRGADVTDNKEGVELDDDDGDDAVTALTTDPAGTGE